MKRGDDETRTLPATSADTLYFIGRPLMFIKPIRELPSKSPRDLLLSQCVHYYYYYYVYTSRVHPYIHFIYIYTLYIPITYLYSHYE